MNSKAPASNSRPRKVGYVGHDVPIELILAANALPAGLHGRVGEPTPIADQYLEPTFSPASRSIAEQWLNGELDSFDAVVFSRSDDSAQRLYYYVCELQRRGQCGGPKP
ncbi:MAG TPA: 2-hydroxyacyl-CoA dehydratase family protein, partial [Steroidobacteraceae bacterium]|nr:2-hydroxyacyl-CoA dehydratase family protein [Steroidobacteraceae bacterium]